MKQLKLLFNQSTIAASPVTDSFDRNGNLLRYLKLTPDCDTAQTW
jgi:hypothetical protein